jgi:serine/threonine-protein kinase RsbW
VSDASAAREVVLTISSDPRNLKAVRALVSAAAQAAGFDKTESNGVCLAVDEACTNVIRHAYLGDATKPIEVRLRIVPPATGGQSQTAGQSPRLEVTLRDWGRKVDPSAIQARDLADVRPGGLGVHFIREIMDEVVYDPTRGAMTEMRMVKFRGTAGG